MGLDVFERRMIKIREAATHAYTMSVVSHKSHGRWKKNRTTHTYIHTHTHTHTHIRYVKNLFEN